MCAASVTQHHPSVSGHCTKPCLLVVGQAGYVQTWHSVSETQGVHLEAVEALARIQYYYSVLTIIPSAHDTCSRHFCPESIPCTLLSPQARLTLTAGIACDCTAFLRNACRKNARTARFPRALHKAAVCLCVLAPCCLMHTAHSACSSVSTAVKKARSERHHW